MLIMVRDIFVRMMIAYVGLSPMFCSGSMFIIEEPDTKGYRIGPHPCAEGYGTGRLGLVVQRKYALLRRFSF